MPAVSMKRMQSDVGARPTVSMASRVVPGRSWTTERSSPMSWLNSVDLPTFGRPTIATRSAPSSSSVGDLARRSAARRVVDDAVEQVARTASVLGAHA